MKRKLCIFVALSAALLVGCPSSSERPADALEPAFRRVWSGRGQIKDIRLPCLWRECRP